MRDQQILIVDSDEVSRKAMRGCFEAANARVFEATNRQEASNCLRNGGITLVTLDIKLGGDDGLVLARDVHRDHRVGIILVTDENDRDVRIKALEELADDFILKPFDIHEFLARARAVARRLQGQQKNGVNGAKNGVNGVMKEAAERSEPAHFNGWVLDPEKRELHDPGGTPVELTVSEYRLLEVLVANRNRVLTRDRILELAGGNGGAEAYDRAIDMRIRRLRSKLGQNGGSMPFIKTVRGVGYKFAVE